MSPELNSSALEYKLTKLIDIGIALSAEKNHNRLLDKIVMEAMTFANADAGSLYLTTRENSLKFVVLRNKSLNLHMNKDDCEKASFPHLYLYDPETGEPNHKNISTHCVLSQQSINVKDAYNDRVFDFSGTRAFDLSTGYHSLSFLTIPLKDFSGHVIGVLQLINAIDQETYATIPFTETIEPLIEALASQAAVAISNQILLEEQKNLFSSFIKVLSDALDAKSPYTGGHCRRVPILTKMIAEEACKVADGPLAAFSLSDEQWEALNMAAGLHDCGKVTTPEYVVDKSTKLETLYNRIHEIRTRFEVLKRDAEISFLKDQLSQETLQKTLQQLGEDFAFVAQMNIGGEGVTPEQIERLEKIASHTWERTLNDKLGLSHEELTRKEKMPILPLPVTETVLQDREDHLIEHYENFLSSDCHPFSFRVGSPKHRFNLGEVYNLSIGRGTLSNEERYLISNHVAMTINMLSALPFPSHLKIVPEYAGGHHEQLNGHGYPDELTAERLSIPARIIAIADVFEALTAADRPYKPAKKLSQVLTIMENMAKNGHIDPDLFQLFLKTNIHQKYGEIHLLPEQMDV